MNISLSRLYQKELRQLAPVVIAITALGFVLFLLRAVLGNSQATSVTVDLTIILLPCMYAFGAAAFLISQEKEQRTINWLHALPVKPIQLVTAKTLVAIVGYILVCSVCWLLVMPWYVQSRLHVYGNTAYGGAASFMLGYFGMTTYLVFAAAAASWRTKTLVSSIFLFLIFAALPNTLDYLVWSISDHYNSMPVFDYVRAYNVFVYVGTVIMVALCFKWGTAVLDNDAARPSRVFDRIATQSLNRIELLRRDRVMTAGSALAWQTMRQIGLPLIAATFVTIVAIVFMESGYRGNPGTAFALLLWASFMGAWTFLPDGAHRRVQFMADRGVSSGAIWNNRVSFALLIVLSAMTLFHATDIQVRVFYPWCFTIFSTLFVAILAYGMAQWSGQFALSPVIGLIQTPILLAVALGYCYFAYFEAATPAWAMLIIGILPYVATHINMQRWIERKLSLRFWVSHLTIALICIAIPLAFLLVYSLQQPKISRAIRTQLRSEAAKWGDYHFRHSEILLAGDFGGLTRQVLDQKRLVRQLDLRLKQLESTNTSDSKPTQDESDVFHFYPVNTAADLLHLKRSIETNLDAIRASENMGNTVDTPSDQPVELLKALVGDDLRRFTKVIGGSRESEMLKVDEPILARLHTLATICRTQFEQSTTAKNSDEAAHWKSAFDQTIELIANLVPKVRNSDLVFQQDNADFLEIVLLNHLNKRENRDLLSDVTIKKCHDILINQDARTLARKRAVALSWQICRAAGNWRGNSIEFGGYIITPTDPELTMRHRTADYLTMGDQADLLAEMLWNVADANPAQAKELLSQLAKFCRMESSWTTYSRAEDFNHFYMAYPRVYDTLPANQWRAGWEQEAVAFAREELVR